MEQLVNRFSRNEDGSAALDWVIFSFGALSLFVAITASVIGQPELADAVPTEPVYFYI